MEIVLDFPSEGVRMPAMDQSRSNNQPEFFMTLLQRYGFYASLIGLGLMAANAQADVINGYAITPRVFNNDPASTLVVTPPALPSNPITFNVHDQYSGPFSGANRHDFLASSDF